MSEIRLTENSQHRRHGSNSGQGLTRREGVLKVTGAATYAADNHPDGMLYAVCATSTIARGRVVGLDEAAARAHPGVVDVMTTANRPDLAMDPDAKTNPFMFRLDLLQNDRVRYAGQAIAVVIAETLEAASEGALLLAPRYEVDAARVGLDGAESFVPQAVGVGSPSLAEKGDVEAGLRDAHRRVEAIYETPAQYHNAMEPHCVVAAWDGDRLSLDMPTQGLAMAQQRLAGLFGIAPENIAIRSPYLGGGFGSKGFPAGPQVLGIMAALSTTLTLPGIAGFVLTIGAAVDANVLINERIREERKRGRRVVAAVETGYREASRAIYDANITNFIAGVLLFLFGSGPVRGFAVVLVIGLFTSVFTAVTLTRMWVAGWLRKAKPKDILL